MRTLPTNDSRHFFGLSPIVIGQLLSCRLPTAFLSTVNSQQSTVNSQQITEPLELVLRARQSVQEQQQRGVVPGLAALREPHQTEFSPARS